MTLSNISFPDDPLLETAQLVKMTGTTPQFWEHLRTIGGGPEFIKIGRLVRYRKSSVERWFSDRTVASTTEGRSLSRRHKPHARRLVALQAAGGAAHDDEA